ncbi:MAG: hypothetical protein GF375_02350 [Candidatus Omnitrophica bacterium]|nr:hypothetical protein [Candidatus Omnitrophota bacterium]
MADEVVTISIGGKLRTFTSRPLGPEDAQTAAKTLAVFYQTGEELKVWRDNLMGLRDIAYTQWPEFVRMKMLPLIPRMSEEQYKLFEQVDNRIKETYDLLSGQYGKAQSDWDSLLPHMNKMKEELGIAGFGYLGNPVPVLIIIAVIAVAASAATVGTTLYLREREITERALQPIKAYNEAVSKKVELTEQTINKIEELNRDIINEADKAKQDVMVKTYDDTVEGYLSALGNIKDVEKTIPNIVEKQAKFEQAVSQENGALGWLKHIPLILLGVVGVMVAPSIAQSLPKRK